MLLTVTWPANAPATSITNGIVCPARPCRRSRRAKAAYDTGAAGICGGGGYALAAAKTDKRFKALATLSMFNSGRVRRNGFADSQLDTVQQRLEQASAARAQEATGGEIL